MKKLKYILPSLFVVTMLTGCWSPDNYYVTTKDVSASVVSTVKVGSKYENTIEFTNNGEMYVLKRRFSFNTENNNNYQSEETYADCERLFDSELLIPHGKVRTKTPYITNEEISDIDFTAYCIYGEIDTSIEFSNITIEKNPNYDNGYLYESFSTATRYFIEVVHVTYKGIDYFFSPTEDSHNFKTTEELDLNELTVKEVFGIIPTYNHKQNEKTIDTAISVAKITIILGIVGAIFMAAIITTAIVLIIVYVNKKSNKIKNK